MDGSLQATRNYRGETSQRPEGPASVKSLPDTDIAISQLRMLLELAERVETQSRILQERLFGSQPRSVVGERDNNKISPPTAFFQATSNLALAISSVLNEANGTLESALTRLGA